MKRIIERVLRVGAVLLAALALSYAFAVISFSDDPRGKYASWQFFPHDLNDVLRFEDGKVTLETCCGTDAYGSYARDEHGRWIWTYQIQHRPGYRKKLHLPAPEYFILHRSLFHLRIELRDKHLGTLDMRRRLFNTFPL